MARGIAKDKSPAKTTAKVSIVEPDAAGDATGNPRSKGKARPMSSKPRKATASSIDNGKAKKQPSEEDIVAEVEDDIDNEDIIDDDDVIDEEAAREERKLGYKRQQTADIGFELPDDDDEDNDDEIDDEYEDDVGEEIVDEDDEA